ncbi:hypothetical protein RE428_36850 [Marinobacter nanhaiticus D15-8W]|nr:hypothetical protein RE428_36850 [Marinobacter nanhaiticus D15-8W]
MNAHFLLKFASQGMLNALARLHLTPRELKQAALVGMIRAACNQDVATAAHHADGDVYFLHRQVRYSALMVT